MRHNQKGFSAVEGLLLVIALTLVGFVGYYVWSKNQDTDTKTSVTPSARPSPSPVTPPASTTYTSKLYPKLSFAVPSGWKVDEPADFKASQRFDTGSADADITVSNSSTKLVMKFTTVFITGFEGYSCTKVSDLAAVGNVLRYKSKEGIVVYREGLIKTDKDWPKDEEFASFDSPDANYCVAAPFVGTYESKLKQADYPNEPYGYTEHEKVLVWMVADMSGTTDAAALKASDSIIASLSPSYSP
jgi:hypothetical protein